jgi:hypothetical protein
MLLPLSIAVAVLGVALFAAGTYAALGVITGRSTETVAGSSPPVASPGGAPPLLAAAPSPEAAASPSLPAAALPSPSLPTPGSRTMELRIRAIPASAEILLDGALVANGTFARTLPCDGIPHMLEVRAAGYVPQHIQFLDIAPISEITLERIPRHHRGPVVATRFEVTSRGLVTVPAGTPQIATTIAPRPAAAPAEGPTVEGTAPTAAAVIAPPAEPTPSVPPTAPAGDARPVAAREEQPAAAPAPTWISGDEELMPFE